MATYTWQYTSGSATAAGDLGTIGLGVVSTGDTLGINPTHLAYGYYAVDLSGRIHVRGAMRSSAGVSLSATYGNYMLGMYSAAVPNYGGVDARAFPLTLDASGALRVIPSGAIGVSALASGTNYLGQVSAYVSGGSALYVTASGAVSARLWDGADYASLLKSAGATALYAAIIDASGNQITAFGGGGGGGAVTQSGDWYVTASGVVSAVQSGDWNITGISYVSGGSAIYVTASGAVSARTWDGSDYLTLRKTAGATGANVSIIDASGNQITSFGSTTVTAYISGITGNVGVSAGSVSAYIASGNLTGLSAVYVTASGAVSARLWDGSDYPTYSKTAGATALYVALSGASGVTVSIATASMTGLSAVYVTASGAVTAVPQATTTWASTAVVVTTATATITGNNANRRSIIITNNGVGNLYLGTATTVATGGGSMGIILPPFASYVDSGPGIYTSSFIGIYDQASTIANVAVADRSA